MEKTFIWTGKPLEKNFPHSRLGVIPYAHGVKVRDATWILLSGAVAFDDYGQVVGKGDMAAQARQVYQNITDALAVVGASVNDIVKENAWTTDMPAYLTEVSPFRAKYYAGREFPATTLIEVKGLSVKELILEVEVIAVLG